MKNTKELLLVPELSEFRLRSTLRSSAIKIY